MALVNKRDLLALYFSGTYCHQTGKRPPSYVIPQQPTIYGWAKALHQTKIMLVYALIHQMKLVSNL